MSETANARQSRRGKSALVIALIVASFMGLYTLWAIEQPELPGNTVVYFFQQFLDYLILPGIIVGVIANASVHLASRWILAGTNFLVYFALAYAVVRYWARRKAKLAAPRPEV